jgi:hypothetical protein
VWEGGNNNERPEPEEDECAAFLQAHTEAMRGNFTNYMTITDAVYRTCMRNNPTLMDFGAPSEVRSRRTTAMCLTAGQSRNNYIRALGCENYSYMSNSAFVRAFCGADCRVRCYWCNDWSIQAKMNFAFLVDGAGSNWRSKSWTCPNGSRIGSITVSQDVEGGGTRCGCQYLNMAGTYMYVCQKQGLSSLLPGGATAGISRDARCNFCPGN